MPDRSSKQIVFVATRPTVVDARHTIKSYIVLYEVIKELSHRNPESIVELLIQNSKAILQDVSTWCEATGNELISSEISREAGNEDMHVVIQKGVEKATSNEHEHQKKKMTVVISTAGLQYVIPPLDTALAGKVLGMDVRVVFEGSGVQLLQVGYRAKLSGLFGGLRTPGVEFKIRNSGCPLPSEAIMMLEELGAKFYACGASMEVFGVRQEALVVEHCTIASTVTWASLLAESDVNAFSRTKFEIP